jgi:L-lactate dehydrogenase complex protein LldG
MTDARTLLGRIASNLRWARAGSDRADVDAAPAVSGAGSAGTDPAALVARFSTEWQALAGHVHEVASLTDAVDAIVGVCEAHGADAILGWTDEAIGLRGLRAALRARGIGIDHGWVPRDPAGRASRLEALASLRIGLTGADALLAESGSVVVTSGPGRPRLASLLPPVHIVVTRATRVYASIEHLFAAEPALAASGSNLVAISGPSRTADIEMTLTRGVHGPGEVHAILFRG